MTGYLDQPSGMEIGGWAWNPSQPGTRLRIAIGIDGEALRNCTASYFRADLPGAGIGDGQHAFSVELPAWVFDGNPHTVTAKLPDGSHLPGSPLRFRSDYQGSLDSIENKEIRGTLRDQSRARARLLAEVYGDNRFLGRAPVLDGSFCVTLPDGFDASRIRRYELFAAGSSEVAATVLQRWFGYEFSDYLFRTSPSRERIFDTAVGIPPSDFDAPYEITVRDYSWICPRVDLVDETGRYCGEPTHIAGCELCYQKQGPREDWGTLLHHADSVATMRRQYREVLENAELVRFPSQDAANRIRRYAPGIRRSEVTSNAAPRPLAAKKAHSNKVAFLGDPRILEACRWEALKRGSAIDFVSPGDPEAAAAFYANPSPDLDASAVIGLREAGHSTILAFDIGASAPLASTRLSIHATPGQILDALRDALDA